MQLSVVEEGVDQKVEHMASYLCEIALYQREFVSTKPFVLSRCFHALAGAVPGQVQDTTRG
jgi:hypothetical protein